MKRLNFSLLLILIIAQFSFGQVGIGTTDPKSSLDIRATNQATPNAKDGLIVPKVNNFSTTNPTADQDGMVVFATGIGTPEKGFYYWDNPTTTWVAFKFATVKKIDDLEDGKSDASGSSVFLGIDAGKLDDGSSNSNVGLGLKTLTANTTGEENTAIGTRAMQTNSTGSKNTAIGNFSLSKNTTGKENSALGNGALRDNTTGESNSALGTYALLLNTTGFHNTAIGRSALYHNTTGTQNTAIGSRALINNTDGSRNLAAGYAAMEKTTTGVQNTAVGQAALPKNTIGSDNVAIGFQSIFNNISANNNIALGTNSLHRTSTGGANVAIGRSSGYNLLGNDNVSIGFEAGYEAQGSANVFLGSKAGREETGSNTLYIENTNSSVPLIGGDFSSDRAGVNRKITDLTNTFEVGGTASNTAGGSWLANSDGRLKKDINTINGNTALNKISKLRGVTYLWNDDKTGMERSKNLQYGFIAQELMEVFPENVTKDNLGYYQTAYGNYDAVFVEAIKELKKQIIEKDDKIENLEKRLEKIEKLLLNKE